MFKNCCPRTETNFGDLDLDGRIKSHKEMGLRAWDGLVYLHTDQQQLNL